MIGGKLLSASAAVQPTYIEDVFSTYLYTGNGSTQTITNGIDLAGEGGLVWTKPRSAATFGDHILVDSERGDFQIQTNTTAANNAIASFNFSSTGYVVPNNSRVNASSQIYASWTFRQAPRFFDVVTYTGTGANRTIAHDLGVVPGCIIVKRTDTTGDWQVYHRSIANTQYLVLNSTAAAATGTTRWNSTTPTSSVFSLGTDATVNASGGTYVAYLFAHDPLGPSGDGSDGLIACGSYTGNGSTTGPVIDLGWEPQWLLVKATSGVSAGDCYWVLVDNMRGLNYDAQEKYLAPNASDAENTITGGFDPTPTGFKLSGSSIYLNGSSYNYIYIAIRRGPMREPTVGTEVFSSVARTATGATYTYTGNAFPVDMVMQRQRTISNTVDQANIFDRLRGVTKYLSTAQTQAEGTNSGITNFDRQDGYIAAFGSWSAMNWTNGSTEVYWNFRRAPGFFDVVAYTGGRPFPYTVPHNLTVEPELMLVKSRSNTVGWLVYSKSLTTGESLFLESTSGRFPVGYWNNTRPTSTVFSISNNTQINGSGVNYIAYLFASLPGISKVGSYTGNGSSQTINCGFTTGARFILIKRTDSTGDWYVWDTARGIVAGNDPHLSLNTTAAEVTTDDTIDPDNSGFIVNQVSATNVNVNAASYIYFAVS